jgi:hypothetical protein
VAIAPARATGERATSGRRRLGTQVAMPISCPRQANPASGHPLLARAQCSTALWPFPATFKSAPASQPPLPYVAMRSQPPRCTHETVESDRHLEPPAKHQQTQSWLLPQRQTCSRSFPKRAPESRAPLRRHLTTICPHAPVNDVSDGRLIARFGLSVGAVPIDADRVERHVHGVVRRVEPGVAEGLQVG